MGKIIQPGNGIMWPGKDETVLKFELNDKENIDLKIKGDPNIIMEMVYQGINNNREIQLSLLTAVVMWADKSGIPLDQLKQHTYFNPKNQ